MAQNFTVDSSTVVWAIRYCRTRYGTYAFGDGLNLILAHYRQMSERDQEVIRRDMEDYLPDYSEGSSHEGPRYYEDRVRLVRDLLYGGPE